MTDLGLIHQSGEKASRWKGGKIKLSFRIRTSPEYSQWRMEVFKRDNFTCIQCKRKRIKGDRVILQVDHIYPLSKIIHENNIKTMNKAISCKALWNINNGRTLCKECHKKTETYGINLLKKKCD